jgi:hypothetical protein
LLLPLLKGTELLVVRIKEFEKSFKVLLDVFIDPRSILKLDHDVERIYHRQVVKTLLIVLEIHEEHAHNTHDLLLVVVVEHLGSMLNQVQSIVAKVRQRELVI